MDCWSWLKFARGGENSRWNHWNYCALIWLENPKAQKTSLIIVLHILRMYMSSWMGNIGKNWWYPIYSVNSLGRKYTDDHFCRNLWTWPYSYREMFHLWPQDLIIYCYHRLALQTRQVPQLSATCGACFSPSLLSLSLLWWLIHSTNFPRKALNKCESIPQAKKNLRIPKVSLSSTPALTNPLPMPCSEKHDSSKKKILKYNLFNEARYTCLHDIAIF